MKRALFFGYGVLAYLIFLATYALMAAFVGNLYLPRSIDIPATNSFWLALVVDLGLIAVFGLQHSVMARPGFKRWWTRIIPQVIERSTYVYVSCAVTLLLMRYWLAVDTVVWDVRQPIMKGLFWGLFAAGWVMVPAVSLMISHFDLFGIRQVWLYLRGTEYTLLPFRTPGLYSRVRHPLYVGWMVAFWATPRMTSGHLMLAAGMTAYIMVAVIFEERDLVSYFGRAYEQYQKQVPMFVPWWHEGRNAT